MIDKATQLWMRDASDELAVRNGCYFDPLEGAYAVWWIERYCQLYEGAYAGTPLVLRGLHGDKIDQWEIPDEFDERAALDRHDHYTAGVMAGHDSDWQYESIMRLFGWKRPSERWGRDIRRYKRASWWVPKKNKKSPTLAAIGLYLLSGDGEQGQKVAICAKDGSQARQIAGKHILEMVRASIDLSRECKINLNEFSVEHMPTRSMLMPFSSSNARTQESKEGFNGSILVDETHVVDRDFMRRVRRAGISREEPIQLEVSTAGTNPDGYGKEQFDYGAEVASGAVENDEFLYIAYAADQRTDPGSLTRDEVIRIGKKANPAWGHTINEKELLADWNESKRSIGETLDFMMYRFNVWQRSASPWLRPGVWDSCYDAGLTLDSLRGKSCVVGFDKSETRDFSAFVAVFPEFGEHGIERVAIWPWIVAPVRYIEQNASLAPFAEWEREGHLIASEGEVIGVGELYDLFGQISEIANVEMLAYDPWKAESITQLIEQGAQSTGGDRLSEGYGVPRIKVNQRRGLFEAIGEFEALANEGKISHPGNPVFDWMMGNIYCSRSGSGTVLQKADAKTTAVRKIDGPVAAITALAVAISDEWQPNLPSYYETNPVEVG